MGVLTAERHAFLPRLPDPVVHVLIPSSFSSEAPSLLEQTLRIGNLARALATYRVERLVVFHEDPRSPERNADLIKLIVEYANTAPYLRRLIYPVTKELKYVGALQPLNIPTHPRSPSIPEGGVELREGLVVKRGESYYVEAGLRRQLRLRSPRRPNSRVYLLVRRKKGGLKFRLISRTRSEYFLGTSVEVTPLPLPEVLKRYQVRIAASRIGDLVTRRLEKLGSLIGGAKGGKVAVAFGSYRRGIWEIAEVQGFDPREVFDAVVNFIPEQGVWTVRTEEAVWAVLTALNLLVSRQGP
ncbi:MAG: putative RNA uridine N3 methyltransferase [Nitrososphaerota archaeon]|nr:putative RNA uridine N3 methyltransferase [Nitrososphaerota archaeon]